MKRPSESIFSDGLMILLWQNLFAQTFQYFGFHGFYCLGAVNFDVFRRVFAFQFAVEINQNFGLLVVNGKAFFHGFFFVVVALNQIFAGYVVFASTLGGL